MSHNTWLADGLQLKNNISALFLPILRNNFVFLQSIVRNNVRLWTSKSAKNLFIETIGLERRNKYQCTISKSETVFHLFDMVHLLSYEMTPYNTTISLCLY